MSRSVRERTRRIREGQGGLERGAGRVREGQGELERARRVREGQGDFREIAYEDMGI